ncbi:MAG: dTDP-4-dehydrorhamnose reductase [Anaerolineales bacterium]|nr:dTDP-4-dehydrorhamnose reductase [Chloroflexota bacterium]MBL6982299.1 dTDP-4-dehydrorhamnose reductase [Anaerolineales bacterium]
MRILLIGKNSQIGWELQRTLAPLGEVYATDSPEIDLGSVFAIRTLVRAVEPEVIINAKSFDVVDQAEKEPSQAHAINSTAPGVLAEEAHEVGAGLVHYSTDYVFDGEKGSPYTEDDEPTPINVYGKSKLEGERAIIKASGSYLILRTSCVYSLRRDCFVTKVLGWAREQRTMRVVSDQVGSPSWSRMLAEITTQMLVEAKDDLAAWLEKHTGIYHLAGSGSASHFDWARAIIENDPHKEEQVNQAVLPARTTEFSTAAERPLYTALNCERFSTEFDLTIPPWEDALRWALADSRFLYLIG